MSKPVYSLSKRKKTVNNESNPIEQLKSLMANDTADKDKNHIYFYTDVDQSTCLDLNRKINDLNKELLKYSIEYDCEPPNIYLHINSNGGCLLSALGTVDTIRNSRVPIVSIIEGCAASAATIISMACHKRYITANSFMLIHQLSTSAYGKYEEIKDDFMNDTKFMERLYSLYRTHTKMTDTKIKSIMTRDIWWDSDECTENGLVDAIWDSNGTSLRVNRLFSNSAFETTATNTIGSDRTENKSKKRKLRSE
jgi:ATP-dependent protease ClpP protease subunit